MQLYDIRYYSQTLNPNRFGKFIRLLNWLRYWLETWIQWRVLKSLVRVADKEVARKYKQQFWKDVKVERLQWKGILPVVPIPVVKEEMPRAEADFVPPVVLKRPNDMGVMARYMDSRKTKRRYLFDEAEPEATEDDDSFEPLEKEQQNGPVQEAVKDVGGEVRSGEGLGEQGSGETEEAR